MIKYTEEQIRILKKHIQFDEQGVDTFEDVYDQHVFIQFTTPILLIGVANDETEKIESTIKQKQEEIVLTAKLTEAEIKP